MTFWRRSAPQLAFLPASQQQEPDPARTAWRIYSALADWIGKVDAKASYALTIESGTLALVIALSQSGNRLGNSQAATVIYIMGAVLLGAGALTAICVVIPRLTSQKKLQDESASNYIYFGHLRLWNPDQLEAILRNDCALSALSRELIVMSECAWKKYRLMQLSFLLSALGAALTVAMLLADR
jgi:hypothetical protein